MKPTLEELAVKYDADKAINKADGTGHGYTPHYERYFTPFREREIKIMEIGVASGPSIQMWMDYFPKAEVIGVDWVKDTNIYNDTKATMDERYKFYHGDQMDVEFWKRVTVEEIGFDIIIDDGGHKNDQIITTFCALWGALNPGGLYCVEDLGVCYSPGSVFIVPGLPTHSEFFKTKLDEVLKDTHGIDWMSLSKELAVIRKRE